MQLPESHSKTISRLRILATLSIFPGIEIGNQLCVVGLIINNSSALFHLKPRKRIKTLLKERIFIEFLDKNYTT